MALPKLIIELNLIIATVFVTSADPNEKWFEQYLDHFNIWENRTFYQKYYEDNQFFKVGGPLLLVIGAETAADSDTLQWNPSHQLAKKLHGMVILLEHRFYGASLPFKNFTTEDLQYLSVEQALEDIAYFVESYRRNISGLNNSKVAVFGCSYAASLATWFRYKFPHLVDAAWASSGPLHAQLDFYEYYEVAGEKYSNISTECIAIIRQGYREAKNLMAKVGGLEEVRNVFSGWECGNVTEMNTTTILSVIRLVVSDQYAAPNQTIESCKFLQSKNSSTSCFQQLSALVKSRAKDICTEEDESDDYAWEYQTCTEFGFVTTTSSNNQPFKDTCSDDIDSKISNCADNFGAAFNRHMIQRGIDRMNRVYGSIDFKATKVLTVHGINDPWHRLGLFNQLNEESPVLLIPGASHCAENENVRHLPELTKAKNIGIAIMEKWLQ